MKTPCLQSSSKLRYILTFVPNFIMTSYGSLVFKWTLDSWRWFWMSRLIFSLLLYKEHKEVFLGRKGEPRPKSKQKLNWQTAHSITKSAHSKGRCICLRLFSTRISNVLPPIEQSWCSFKGTMPEPSDSSHKHCFIEQQKCWYEQQGCYSKHISESTPDTAA